MPRQWGLIAGLVVLLLIIVITGINGKRTIVSPNELTCRNCNVVFVSFDTLRADHVGSLGYRRNTTPNLDRLVTRAVAFTNAVAVTSWTLPSTMSWFTGVTPSTHKVLNKYVVDSTQQEEIANLQKLSPNLTTLAQVMKEEGYATGAFTGGAGVDSQFGFDQGFDTYTDEVNFGGFKDTVPKALSWISEHKSEKMFIFLHGYDIHGQYVPEGGYDKRFVDFAYKGKLTGSKEEQEALREDGLTRGNIFLTSEDVRFLTALYDEKIARADAEFNKFLDGFSRLGLLDKTVFIITSDHGEELYEHGRIDHGHSLYDELLRVPLFILTPSFNKRTAIDEQVRSIDLMPTVLELVGLTKDEDLRRQMQGVSLVPLMKGQKQRLDAFVETDYRYIARLRGLRTWEGWKLIANIETSAKELYNLMRDSKETMIIASESLRMVEITDKLQQVLSEQ